jgi:hypothetical protein
MWSLKLCGRERRYLVLTPAGRLDPVPVLLLPTYLESRSQEVARALRDMARRAQRQPDRWVSQEVEYARAA